MDYGDFVDRTQTRAELGSRSEAEAAVQAVLRSLGLRLSGGEAQNLAANLPFELQEVVTRRPEEERPQTIDADEFVAAVAAALDVDRTEGERRTRAVFAVLYEALDASDFAAVMSQLPEDLAALTAETGGAA